MAIVFPTSLDSFVAKVDSVDYPQAIDINDPQDAIEALEAKVGVDSSAVTTSLDYKVNNFFTTGRKLWLYEDTAPTGWTVVSVTDAVLAVKGGTNAYNASGGTLQGTWTQTTHTHGIGSYAQAAHNHQWYVYNGSANDQSYNSGGTATDISGITKVSYWMTTVQNGGSGIALQYDQYTNNKTPTLSGTSGTGATASTYRPYATVGIIVQKT